jgi:hypothetical protein
MNRFVQRCRHTTAVGSAAALLHACGGGGAAPISEPNVPDTGHSANGEPTRYAADNAPCRSSGDTAAARGAIGRDHLNPEQGVFTGCGDHCGERDRYLAGGR